MYSDEQHNILIKQGGVVLVRSIIMWNDQTSWTIYLSPQQKVEEAQREKDELVKNMGLLQQEKEQLEAEKESLQKECEQEKETCTQLRRENQVGWKWTESIFDFLSFLLYSCSWLFIEQHMLCNVLNYVIDAPLCVLYLLSFKGQFYMWPNSLLAPPSESSANMQSYTNSWSPKSINHILTDMNVCIIKVVIQLFIA